MAKAGGKNDVGLYGQSRRSYGRVDVQIPGTFRTLSDRAHVLTTVNVSEAGLLFRTDYQLQVGSIIELSVQTDPDTQVTGSGRVVHVENAGDGTYRTAVQIMEVRTADRARLAKRVRTATASEFPVAETISRDAEPSG